VSEYSAHSAGGRLDADGLLVVPGLVDLQVNGAAGVDLSSEPERLWDVAAHLPTRGVTSFLPTIVTTDGGIRDRAMRALAAGPPADGVARAAPLGLHFEGPMLSPERCGAHPPEALRPPSPDLVEGWSPENGVVMVTIAPELPGALEVIALLAARGVVVSIGHTAATLEQVDAAVAAGARAVTHLFNGMPGLGHREPGVVGAALSGGDLVAGVIVDGLHVHPRTVAAAWRALGPDRFLAVSDTTAALDQPPGRSVLGRHEVLVADGAVRLASDGATLAGSAVGLDDCVRRLAEYTGCTPAEAVAATTAVPARLFPVHPAGHRLGVLDGTGPDATLLDADLRVAATVIGDRVAYDRDGRELTGVTSWRS
jgi:N-acetylglucosamine-6-phosphate deacetylase